MCLVNNTFTKTGYKMYQFVDKFRSFSGEIQAQTIQTFLYVVMSNEREVAMQDMGKALGLSQASVSRNISFFNKINRHRKKGVGLLSTREDPQERRRKLVHVTNQGLKFYHELEDIIK